MTCKTICTVNQPCSDLKVLLGGSLKEKFQKNLINASEISTLKFNRKNFEIIITGYKLPIPTRDWGVLEI